ncbi:S8 family peptidase [Synechocystis sp. PCC 7509]|uniref:S8 family peptidase n=1 Tax=Synechocystis sp. PCC 7509 TaxID=927677 RepID=UPI0002AC4DC6|nr:S8 family serine peptidase [Synechocystis sp. PCC 7509]
MESSEQRQIIQEARARIRTQYGSLLAEKASDEFCLTHASPSAFAAAEAFPSSISLLSSIIEFATEDQANGEILEAAQPQRMLTWEPIKESLAQLNLSQQEQLRLYTGLRQTRVAAEREQVLKSVSPITAELERHIERLFALHSEALREPSSLTQVCWLNQSLRTLADPTVLAEVVADPKIAKVDLPRRLEAEVMVTGSTVGAVQYREKYELTGRGIVIAIIDSEVAISHPAFQHRVIHRQNYTQEPWGSPDKHGTAVAGIAAANHADLIGMAPEATVYNYKVLATNRSLNANNFEGSLALQQALEDGVHIANCSWGVGLANGETREVLACNKAWSLGMTIVKSAGNRGPGSGTVTNPGQADGIIVVGATDRNGIGVQDYSSRGSLQGGLKRPHFVAPGGTESDSVFSCLVGGGFGNQGVYGTSFAAPHVTGLLALLLEKVPDLSPDEQRDLLLRACTAFQNVDANTQGLGLISLKALIEEQ